MRTLTETAISAITQKDGIRFFVRAVIETSRSFFSTLTDDDPTEAGDFASISETPRAQAMCYDAQNDRVVTVVVEDDGDIVGYIQGSSSPNDTGLNTQPGCKPSLWDRGDGTAYIWWWNHATAAFSRAVLNLSTFAVSGSWGTSPSAPYGSIDRGSMHAVSETEAVLVYRNTIGGVGVMYYDGTNFQRWQRRFMSPYTASSNAYWTTYSAAAKLGNRIYVYSTDLAMGHVRGVYYDILDDVWSDSFVAVPADLCRFCVSNAVVANGYIHLAGQFHRTKDLAGAKIYSLIIRSSDGMTFSWDRFTLLSTLGYQFHIDYHSATDLLYASDRNCIGEAYLSYFFKSPTGTAVTLNPPQDIVEFSASSNDSGALQVRAANEAYFNHSVIAKNNRVKLYIGVVSTTGESLVIRNETVLVEWFLYNTYIISGVDEEWADGVRNLALQLTAEGLWKTSQIAFPFYSEIISKSTLYDDCDNRDHLYPAPASGSGGSTSNLVVDFWNSIPYENTGEGITGFAFVTSSGTGAERKDTDGTYKYGFQTELIQDAAGLDEDPEILATSITLAYYGWCRTSVDSRPNDTISMKIITEDDDGAETVHDATLTSTYSKFPRDWENPNQAGSYPITFQVTGLTIGHKLLRVIVVQENGSGGTSCSVPERVEISDVGYTELGSNPGLTWLQTKPDSYSATQNTILELPGAGSPYVQFATKPYTAFNFQVSADFEHDAGTASIAVGKGGWGLVGHATDGNNYTLGRYNLVNDRLEVVKVRNGEETVLAYESVSGIRESIWFEHRDGELFMRYLDSGVWSVKKSWVMWDEATHGAMSTSDKGIMHVGVYGIKSTLGFQIPSFNAADGDGIAIIAKSDVSILSSFPSSGTVTIDNVQYSYTGKTLTAVQYGPYGARNTGNWPSYFKSGQNFYGGAVEIGLFLPDASNTLCADYLLASDNGHTWLLRNSDWLVAHEEDYLLNRSRHFGEHINGDHVGTNNRMFIVPGLTGIARVGGGEGGTHPYGSWCWLAATDRIWVKRLMASTVDRDATVRDMCDVLCKVASVPAEFPGDTTVASVNVQPTPVAYPLQGVIKKGGFDIRYETPANFVDETITVWLENVYGWDAQGDLGLDVHQLNGGFLRVGVRNTDQWPEWDDCYIETSFGGYKSRSIRLLVHDQFATFYIDDHSVCTFAVNTITWPQTINVGLTSTASLTITNLHAVELCDWREAIYVESEMNAASALGSVIQERPVEIIPTVSGGLSFSYNLVRDTIAYTNAISKRLVRRHRKTQLTSSDSGSDAIVYYRDIAFVSNNSFAEREGFLTRVLKLSQLDYGAEAAAEILLEKANERQYPHSLEMRPDLRLEPGDILQLHYLTTGTGRQVDHNMVIEDTSIRIRDGDYTMSASAREDL